MRMPGMSGGELLSHVSQHYPHVIRIVLSGMCDKEQSLSSAVSAHQFLLKPCNPAVLKAAVDRAIAVNDSLGDPVVKAFISRLKSLPSMPAMYTELVAAAQDPDASAQQLGDIVSKDLAMTSKVLHLVNSALFGLSRPVLNAGEACIFLGVDTIKVLALSLGIFSQYRRRGLFSVEELQSHSLRTAALAKLIATHERLSKVEVDEVFLAAMLHDVGKLVLALNCHRDYEECIAFARARNLPLFEAESQKFGLTHAEVGMYLLRLWGLPDAVADAVAFHHRPSASGVRVLGSLAIVHAADVLICEEDHLPTDGLDVAWMSGLNKVPRVDEWRKLRTGAIEGAA